ncbi:hypothetical protein J7J90_03525 [Candidatus Micrarchaeota archaeon]|nr:hypothetical protein [Candidatus Micrarchaeota archaeon]
MVKHTTILLALLFLLSPISFSYFMDMTTHVLDNGSVSVIISVYNITEQPMTEAGELNPGCETVSYTNPATIGVSNVVPDCDVNIFILNDTTKTLVGSGRTDNNGTLEVIISGSHFNPGKWYRLSAEADKCSVTSQNYVYIPAPGGTDVENVNNLLTLLFSKNQTVCLLFSLLVGVLAASMFYFGANPLSMLDIVTPKFKRFRAVRKRVGAVGKSQSGRLKRLNRIYLNSLVIAGKAKKILLKTFGSTTFGGIHLKMWFNGTKGMRGISYLSPQAQLAAIMMLLKGRHNKVREMLRRATRMKEDFTLTDEEKRYAAEAMNMVGDIQSHNLNVKNKKEYQEMLKRILLRYGIDMEMYNVTESGVNYMSQLMTVKKYRESVNAEFEWYRPGALGKVPLVGGVVRLWTKPKNRFKKQVKHVSEWAEAYKKHSLVAKGLYYAATPLKKILWKKKTPKQRIAAFYNPVDRAKVNFEDYRRGIHKMVSTYIYVTALSNIKTKKERDKINKLYQQMIAGRLELEEFYKQIMDIVDISETQWSLTVYNDFLNIINSSDSCKDKFDKLTVFLSSFQTTLRDTFIETLGGSVEGWKNPVIVFPFMTDYDSTPQWTMNTKNASDTTRKKRVSIEKMKYAWAFFIYAEKVANGEDITFDDALADVEIKIKEFLRGRAKELKFGTGKVRSVLQKDIDNYNKAFSTFLSEVDSLDALLGAEEGEIAQILKSLGLTFEDLQKDYNYRTLSRLDKVLRDRVARAKTLTTDKRIINQLDRLLSSFDALIANEKKLVEHEETLPPEDKTLGIEDYVMNKTLLSLGYAKGLGKGKLKPEDIFRRFAFSREAAIQTFLEYYDSLDDGSNEKEKLKKYLNKKVAIYDDNGHKIPIKLIDALQKFKSYDELLKWTTSKKIRDATHGYSTLADTDQMIIVSKLYDVVERMYGKIVKSTPPEKLSEMKTMYYLLKANNRYNDEINDMLGLRLKAVIRDHSSWFMVDKVEKDREIYNKLANKYEELYGKNWEEYISQGGPTYEDLQRGVWVFTESRHFMPYFKGAPVGKSDTIENGVLVYNARGKTHYMPNELFGISSIDRNGQVNRRYVEMMERMYKTLKDNGVNVQLADGKGWEGEYGYNGKRIVFNGKRYDPNLLEFKDLDYKRSIFYKFVDGKDKDKNNAEFKEVHVYQYNDKEQRFTERIIRIYKDNRYDSESYTKKVTFSDIKGKVDENTYVDINRDVYLPLVREANIATGHPYLDEEGISIFGKIMSDHPRMEFVGKMDSWGYFDIKPLDELDKEYLKMYEGDKMFNNALVPLLLNPAITFADAMSFGLSTKLAGKIFQTKLGAALRRFNAKTLGSIGAGYDKMDRSLMVLFTGLKMELTNSHDIADFAVMQAAQQAKESARLFQMYNYDLMLSGVGKEPPRIESIRKQIYNTRKFIEQVNTEKNKELDDLLQQYRNEQLSYEDYGSLKRAVEEEYYNTVNHANKQLDKLMNKLESETAGYLNTRLRLNAEFDARADLWYENYQRIEEDLRKLRKYAGGEYKDVYKALEKTRKQFDDMILKNANLTLWEWGGGFMGPLTLKLDPNNEQRWSLLPFGVHAAPTPSELLSSNSNIYAPLQKLLYPLHYELGMIKQEFTAMAKRASWSSKNANMYDPALPGPKKWEAFVGTAEVGNTIIGTLARLIHEYTGAEWASKVYHHTHAYYFDMQGVAGRDYYTGVRKFLPEQWDMFINLENINKDRITYTGWDGRRHYTPQAARILVAIHPDYTLENPDLRNDVYRDIYSKFDDQGHFAGELGSALWPSLLMAKDEYLRYVMDQKKFSSIWYMINPLYMAGEYPFATVGALTLGPIGMGIGYFGSTFLRTSQEIKHDKRKFKDAASKVQEYLFSPLDRAGIDVPDEVKTFGQIIVGYRVCKHGHLIPVHSGERVTHCWCGEKLE